MKNKHHCRIFPLEGDIKIDRSVEHANQKKKNSKKNIGAPFSIHSANKQ